MQEVAKRSTTYKATEDEEEDDDDDDEEEAPGEKDFLQQVSAGVHGFIRSCPGPWLSLPPPPKTRSLLD